MKNTDIYNLMNKDTLILQFNISTGEIINQTESSIPYYLSRLIDKYDGDPDGEQPIISWVKSRIAFYCLPTSATRFLYMNIYRCSSLSEVIDKFHCISMNDTFWVKNIKQEKLKWNSISPYSNLHSDFIYTYTLNSGRTSDKFRKDIKGADNSLSPVPGTRGSYPHAWKQIPSHSRGGTVEIRHIFVKASSKYRFESDGEDNRNCIEPYSEYIASQIGQYLGFNCLEYKLKQRTFNIGANKYIDTITECECYTTEEIGSVAAKDLGLNTYEKVIDYCIENLGIGSLKVVLDMLFIDCLLINPDRHFRNIEFLMSNSTLEIIGIAPIFDNNKAFSFLTRTNIENKENWKKEISQIRKKYRAYDRKRLRELFTLVCSYKSYESELQKLKEYRVDLEDFGKEGLAEEQLEFMNYFLQDQIRYLLRVDREIRGKQK